MAHFRLTLAYDGTDFFGSQVQPKRRTVQGELLAALVSVGAGHSRATLAGRTDKGVHAVGQVGAVHAPGWCGDASCLERALAATIPADMAVSGVCQCDEGFHPRFDAAWREYRYWFASGTPDPRLGRFSWMLRSPLETAAMRQAAIFLDGRHDFATFASGGEGVPWSERAGRPRGTMRSVLCCGVRELDPGFGSGSVVELRIVADGFLPRMVRNIAGALVEVGQGRRSPDWFLELLAARDRRDGPPTAPAHGLTLWAVGYGSDPITEWIRKAPQAVLVA